MRASARIWASGATSCVKAEVGMMSARLAALMSRMTALPAPAAAPMRWRVNGLGWDMGFSDGCRSGDGLRPGRPTGWWCENSVRGVDDLHRDQRGAEVAHLRENAVECRLVGHDPTQSGRPV